MVYSARDILGESLIFQQIARSGITSMTAHCCCVYFSHRRWLQEMARHQRVAGWLSQYQETMNWFQWQRALDSKNAEQRVFSCGVDRRPSMWDSTTAHNMLYLEGSVSSTGVMLVSSTPPLQRMKSWLPTLPQHIGHSSPYCSDCSC